MDLSFFFYAKTRRKVERQRTESKKRRVWSPSICLCEDAMKNGTTTNGDKDKDIFEILIFVFVGTRRKTERHCTTNRYEGLEDPVVNDLSFFSGSSFTPPPFVTISLVGGVVWALSESSKGVLVHCIFFSDFPFFASLPQVHPTISSSFFTSSFDINNLLVSGIIRCLV